jgi:hypothetical protein
MDKVELRRLISNGNPSIEKILGWVNSLPSNLESDIITDTPISKVKPIKNKIGDVYMHGAFKHPYILLENKGNYWLCGLLTSESRCPEILEPCKSRFFDGKYITKALFTASEISGSFVGCYDNSRHLRIIRFKLKTLFQ